MRYAAGVEYCGRQYSGWQRQKQAASIQAHVESALSKVADHKINITCAGRTDAGVHASYQVIHFDSEAVRQRHAWLFGCNSHLPADISLIWVIPTVDDFHARFSALKRHYRYLILNRPSRPAVLHQYLSWEHRPLDVDKMSRAAQCLVGTHDFSSFRASGCQAKSPIREMSYVHINKVEQLIELRIAANAFLQHMVRNILGVLLAVGTGREEEAWVAEVLAAKSRASADMTAPASGLTLTGVDYADDYHLPQPVTSLIGAASVRQES